MPKYPSRRSWMATSLTQNSKRKTFCIFRIALRSPYFIVQHQASFKAQPVPRFTERSCKSTDSGGCVAMVHPNTSTFHLRFRNVSTDYRSEERRVGKECRSRW